MQLTRRGAPSLAKSLAATVAWWALSLVASGQTALAGEPLDYPLPAENMILPSLTTSAPPIAFSEFIEAVQQGRVVAVKLSGTGIRGRFRSGVLFTSVMPAADSGATVQTLLQNKVRIEVEDPVDLTRVIGVVAFPLSVVLLLAMGLIYFRRGRPQQGDGAVAKGFCGSQARGLAADEVKTRFDDVAGVEESKQEVAEIVEFLRDPGKFGRLGGRIPKGVLMSGPPGTGKTLLARAIAGEAQVPFFSMSGSEFVQMYVGVGASRVRGLFEQAKVRAPCIVFIDEIDAVGRQRNSAATGGHEERDQTLNQLLVEMDGFDSNKGVIVIAATNRPDVLDPALLRPGRFDRQVVVPLPDVRGREEILRVHMRQVRLAGDVDPMLIARGTPGFSGAELANLVNEAALFAARASGDAVGMSEFERAKDKIMMGGERRSMALSERDREVTAYHEAGHALVGLNVPDHDPVYKVSILPRGRALGVTAYLPETDRCSHTKLSLNSRICALLAGRAAEALIFGEQRITSGASNDIKCATEIARRMVTEYGMSDNLGPVDYSGEESSAGVEGHAPFADDTARTIDQAIRESVELNYKRAREILESNVQALHRLAGALLQYETLDQDEIQKAIARSS